MVKGSQSFGALICASSRAAHRGLSASHTCSFECKKVCRRERRPRYPTQYYSDVIKLHRLSEGPVHERTILLTSTVWELGLRRTLSKPTWNERVISTSACSVAARATARQQKRLRYEEIGRSLRRGELSPRISCAETGGTVASEAHC